MLDLCGLVCCCLEVLHACVALRVSVALLCSCCLMSRPTIWTLKPSTRWQPPSTTGEHSRQKHKVAHNSTEQYGWPRSGRQAPVTTALPCIRLSKEWGEKQRSGGPAEIHCDIFCRTGGLVLVSHDFRCAPLAPSSPRFLLTLLQTYKLLTSIEHPLPG